MSGLRFTQFFISSTDNVIEEPTKKKPASRRKRGGSKRRTKSKIEDKSSTKKADQVNDPAEVTELLKKWDAIRQIVRSLEKLGVVTITKETIISAIPELRDSMSEALPQIAERCPAVLSLVEDSVSGTVAVFPEVLISTKEKQITLAKREEARRNVLRAALIKQNSTPLQAETKKRALDTEEDKAKDRESNTFIRLLKNCDWYQDQIAHIERLETVPPQFISYNENQIITRILNQDRLLYKHQALALKAALDGNHVVLATGTASGKSLAYKAATLESAHKNPVNHGCLALYLFPTKALAQDQLGHLRSDFDRLAEKFDNNILFSAATLDGDTGYSDRATICDEPPTIILTNPDFLHFTALGDDRWRKALLSRLKYVVIDESHVYVGAFGAHVACVLRRLQRLCKAYGSSPIFFATSATIANPKEHTLSLLPICNDEQLIVITEDTSPRNAKAIVIWNPPLKSDNSDAANHNNNISKPKKRKSEWRRNIVITKENNQQDKEQLDARIMAQMQLLVSEKDRAELAIQNRNQLCAALNETIPEQDKGNEFLRRRSSIYETARIVAQVTTLGIRSICFCRTRKLVELVLMYARDLVDSDHLKNKMAAYRGGYDKSERRIIEKGLFGGSLVCVVATCALELGVDVGELDATIHLGHPGSIASLWQQAGRAGRRPGSESIAIVVCWDSPLDQQLARAGSRLLKRGVEAAALDIQNENVLRMHLRYAAIERPLDPDTDAFLFCPSTRMNDKTKNLPKLFLSCINELVCRGEIEYRSGLYAAHPILNNEKKIQLRTIDPIQFQVHSSINNVKLDEIPYSRAFYELYQGAIYMHQAKPFLITKLDIKKYIAIAQPLKHCAYYTSAQNHTDADPIDILDIWPLGNICRTGLVRVHSHVWGYRKICKHTGKFLSSHEFSLPPLEFITRGIWLDLPQEAIHEISQANLDLHHGIHACTHAILNIVPLFVVCDNTDVNAEHVYISQKRPRPARIIIFDTRPGGIGVAHAIFRRIYAVISEALRLITECPCHAQSGCPSCLFSASCTAHNLALDSRAAIIIFRAILKCLSPTTQVEEKEQKSLSPLKRPVLASFDDETPSSSPLEISANQNDITRRTRRRASALRRAAMLDDAATNGITVRSGWAPCLPDFQPGFDSSRESQSQQKM